MNEQHIEIPRGTVRSSWFRLAPPLTRALLLLLADLARTRPSFTERGELLGVGSALTSMDSLRHRLAWKHNRRTVLPSLAQVRWALRTLRRHGTIACTATGREPGDGLLIRLCFLGVGRNGSDTREGTTTGTAPTGKSEQLANCTDCTDSQEREPERYEERLEPADHGASPGLSELLRAGRLRRGLRRHASPLPQGEGGDRTPEGDPMAAGPAGSPPEPPPETPPPPERPVPAAPRPGTLVERHAPPPQPTGPASRGNTMAEPALDLGALLRARRTRREGGPDASPRVAPDLRPPPSGASEKD